METLECLELLNLTTDQEYMVSGLVSDLLHPDGFRSVRQLRGSYYPHWERVLTAINEVLGLYGVECIKHPNSDEPLMYYANNGESYRPTIVYNRSEGDFEVASWGGWYESWLQDQAELWDMRQCPYCFKLSELEELVQTGNSDDCPHCGNIITEHEVFTLRYYSHALAEGCYTLKLRSTGKRDSWGKWLIWYQLSDTQGVIFEGADFAASPLHDPESIKSAAALLSFLTLQEHDIEEEYFAGYNERQLSFRDTEAEELGWWAYELEEE